MFLNVIRCVIAFVMLAPMVSSARCFEGSTGTCWLPNGCVGRRQCIGGLWGGCECNGGGGTVSCSVCGGAGSAQCNSSCDVGVCSRAEICNGCDDNADGLIDNGAGCFVPTSCSACPTMTEVDWSYNSSNTIPADPNCAGATCPHYINFVDHTREVRANYNVKKFEFRVDSFDTEQYYDYLTYRETWTGNGAVLQGSPPTGWYGVTVSQNLQNTPVELEFQSDMNVTRPGFAIGKGRVCCGPVAAMEPAELSLLRATTGVLLATNDVVMFKTPVRPPGQKLNLALSGNVGDFDLYVRCNAFPTPMNFDHRGFSGNSQEFLSFDGTACTYPGTWYIAVNSYASSGQFTLVASPMFAAKEQSNIRVGTDFIATPAQMATFADTLAQAARQFYGQTEGQILTSHYHLFNSGDCSNCGGNLCNFCFRNSAGTGSCCPGGQLMIFQGYWADPEGVAHEISHAWLGIGDEYDWDAQGVLRLQCGHSNMASPWGTQNNHCWDAYGHDHKEDKDPLIGNTLRPAAWNTCYPTETPMQPWRTPDNYDYRDHDFNNGIVVDTH